MPSTKKKKSENRRKKSWNIKKKGEEKKSSLRGLPKPYIQQYGDRKEVKLINGKVWEEFYGSADGIARSNALVARYKARQAEVDKKLASQVDPSQFKQNDVASVLLLNEGAKLAARG